MTDVMTVGDWLCIALVLVTLCLVAVLKVHDVRNREARARRERELAEAAETYLHMMTEKKRQGD